MCERSLILEVFVRLGFFFHFCLLYCGYFRLLKFIVSLEVVSVVIFFFFFFFFFFCVFLFFLFFCGYFRLLKFIVFLEVFFFFFFFFFCLVMVKGEFSGLLFYLAVLACEASVGLGLLVGLLRFYSVGNVKVDVCGSF